MENIERKYDLVKSALVVGVDIAKSEHVAAFWVKEKGVVGKVKFKNDLGGFQRLVREIDRVCALMGIEKVVLGLEPTAHYWQALAYWWEDHRGTVVLVNPMNTKRAKELDDNSPLKTDLKDAGVIAWLISEGKFLECRLPRGKYAVLRDLVRQRARCGSLEVRLVNQLRQTVDRIFPELDEVFANFMSVSCRKFLLKYADPEIVTKLSSRRLSQELRRWSGGRYGLERAQQLIELATKSIGIREGKTAVKAEIRRLVIQLNALREERKVIESEIHTCLKELPGARLLLTIPGFGDWTVATILSRTGDLRNYKHPDQVLKLAGLNLYEISSGKHKGRIRITKRGSGLLRKILYMAAFKACRKTSVFHPYYERLTQSGNTTTSASVSLMRKLLRISWAISNKQEPFDQAQLDPALAKAA